MDVVLLIGVSLRLLFLVVSLNGALYALRNWLDARRDLELLKRSDLAGEALTTLLAAGFAEDQRRVSAAQLCLGLAALGILALTVVSPAPVSPLQIFVYLSVLACSFLLAFKSFAQRQRRTRAMELIRHERDASGTTGA